MIAEQFPELSPLPLRALSRGWDNTNLRVGDELLARIPHREVAVELIINEQRWLPILAPRLDLPVPSPTHAGRPTTNFPWAWSITPFTPGVKRHRPSSAIRPSAQNY